MSISTSQSKKLVLPLFLHLISSHIYCTSAIFPSLPVINTKWYIAPISIYILYSLPIFSINLLIRLLVSPFVLGDPFNISVFIIIFSVKLKFFFPNKSFNRSTIGLTVPCPNDTSNTLNQHFFAIGLWYLPYNFISKEAYMYLLYVHFDGNYKPLSKKCRQVTFLWSAIIWGHKKTSTPWFLKELRLLYFSHNYA